MFSGIDLSPGSSALVIQDGGGVTHYEHFQEDNTKRDMLARFRMAEKVWDVIRKTEPSMIAIEDYALGKGENVSYQIAEVAGILKYKIMEASIPLVLVNPRKLKSYVVRQRDVTKEMIIAWSDSRGFSPKIKQRGIEGGFYKRQREDLADAFVLSCISKELHMFLSEGTPPRKGDIILDPDNGLAFRKDLLFNNDFWSKEIIV